MYLDVLFLFCALCPSLEHYVEGLDLSMGPTDGVVYCENFHCVHGSSTFKLSHSREILGSE